MDRRNALRSSFIVLACLSVFACSKDASPEARPVPPPPTSAISSAAAAPGPTANASAASPAASASAPVVTIATQAAPKGWPTEIPVCAGKVLGKQVLGKVVSLDLRTPEPPERIFAFYKSALPGYTPSMDTVSKGNAMLTMTGPLGKFNLAAVTTDGHHQATLTFEKK